MRGYVVNNNRELKAEKILAILEEHLQKDISKFMILDIGTGNGKIANCIANKNNIVYSVDVVNQIDLGEEEQRFQFKKVNDENLPFKDEVFDIVISNHVVEHITDSNLHLKEIKRVLKREGICYFATPNRNFIRDPHTKTFFIHWFSFEVFFWILKKLKRYQEPVKLLWYKEMKKMFRNTGFNYKEYTADVINKPNKYKLECNMKIKIPKYMQAISPTNIFVLEKR